MINVEPCKGCGAIILLGELMGLRAKCDPQALDAQEAVAALLAGRELHRVTYVGDRPANLSPARPAVLSALLGAEPPMVVRSHSCPNASAPVSRPNSTPGGTMPPKAGGRPPVPPSRPFSGQSTVSSTHGSAQSAANQASDRCSACRLPAPLDVRDRLVVAQLGAAIIGVTHRTCPPATGVSGC